MVLLSVPLCYRLAMEGCHRRKEELREVQSFGEYDCVCVGGGELCW